jgi:hypothetical protein
MWTKDYYQEQMLGYLDWVQTEIEELEPAYGRQNDLNELYDDLEIALERLWWLIGASDVDWEDYRYPVETSCDALLRVFNPLPSANSLALSGVSFHPISSLVLLGTGVVQGKPEMTSSEAH